MKAARTEKRSRRWTSPRALVHLDADGIRCDLFVRSGKSREQFVTYELVIFNETDAGISCRLYGIDGSGHTREFGMLTIRALSAGNSFFAVPVETDDRRRLFLEVVGNGINLFAEALQPATRATSRWPVFVVASLMVSAASVLGTAYAHHIRAAGSTGDHSQIRYRATMLNGSPVASGMLVASSGELALRLPSRLAGHTIRLRLDPSGPSGETNRTTTVAVNAHATTIVRALTQHTAKPVASAVKTDRPSVSPSDVISIAGRVFAGKTFNVSIHRPLMGMRIQFKDEMQAVVADIAVPAHSRSVTLFAPASPVIETYSLGTSSEPGSSAAASMRSLKVYPQ